MKEEGAVQVASVNNREPLPARPPGNMRPQQDASVLLRRGHGVCCFSRKHLLRTLSSGKMTGPGAPGQTCPPKSLDSRGLRPEDGRGLSPEVEGLPGVHGSVPRRRQVLPPRAPGKNPFPRVR